MLLLDGMELQLGLALPSNSIKGFDLNSYVCEPKEVLGSDTLNHLGSCFSSTEETSKLRKRCLTEAFDQQPQTLPLLAWNNHPNEEDDGKELDQKHFIINKYDIGDEDGVVGWPPVNSWRKKLCYLNRGGHVVDHDGMVDNGGGGGGGGGGGRGSNSMYVKVKMEGMGIARKVDLSRHQSYQTLADTLVDMFWIRREDVKAYKLTYQDKEGDWLLAGDVPWLTFIQSVQRLKLLRTRAD